MEFIGKVYWRDGTLYGERRVYVMEHAFRNKKKRLVPCKVTASEMWNFCTKSIANNELGTILAYERLPPAKKKISRNMDKMIRDVRDNFAYMLCDVPGLSVLIVSCIDMRLTIFLCVCLCHRKAAT